MNRKPIEDAFPGDQVGVMLYSKNPYNKKLHLKYNLSYGLKGDVVSEYKNDTATRTKKFIAEIVVVNLPHPRRI